MKMRVVAAALVALTTGCPRKDPPPPEVKDATPVATSSVPEVVPPAAPFNATPVAQLADAGNLEGQPPFEQAKVYEANGQLWMARLLLERKALGPDATKDETELLLKVCEQQGDAGCVQQCAAKLGRKIKFDGGAPAAKGSASAGVGGEHNEPDTDLARARDLVLKRQFDVARKSLEPKVLDGKATREEIRLLRTICEKQNDRMCIAVCDAKLK